MITPQDSDILALQHLLGMNQEKEICNPDFVALQALWHPEILSLQRRLIAAGVRCVLVGGTVRDALLGSSPNDYDMAVGATPQQLRSLLPQAAPTGDASGQPGGTDYGTLTLRCGDVNCEITPFRAEDSYTDARHPDTVTFGVTLEQDLARRDFTVNAIAWDGTTLIDPYDGRADMERRVLRTVGVAKCRFREDGLRILRAVRFASVLSFRLHEDILFAISGCRRQLRSVSVPRLRAELQTTLLGANPAALAALLAPDALRFIGLRAPEQLSSSIISEQSGATTVPEQLSTAAAPRQHDAASATLQTPCTEIQPSSSDIQVLRTLVASVQPGALPTCTVRLCTELPNLGALYTLLAPLAQVPCRMLPRWWALLTLLGADKKYVCTALGFSADFYRDLVLLDSFFTSPIGKTGWKRRAAGLEGRLPLSILLILQTFAALDSRFAQDLFAWEQVEAQHEPYTLSALAVNGDALLQMGLRGAAVGNALRLLLDAVIAAPGLNRAETLLAIARAAQNSPLL